MVIEKLLDNENFIKLGFISEIVTIMGYYSGSVVKTKI